MIRHIPTRWMPNESIRMTIFTITHKKILSAWVKAQVDTTHPTQSKGKHTVPSAFTAPLHEESSRCLSRIRGQKRKPCSPLEALLVQGTAPIHICNCEIPSKQKIVRQFSFFDSVKFCSYKDAKDWIHFGVDLQQESAAITRLARIQDWEILLIP